MPSRPFPARTIVTPLTSNNHCGHCRKHPETPGLSQYKRFIKKSADIHTYQRDAPALGVLSTYFLHKSFNRSAGT
jgi:hypothetical protein